MLAAVTHAAVYDVSEQWLIAYSTPSTHVQEQSWLFLLLLCFKQVVDDYVSACNSVYHHNVYIEGPTIS